MGACTSATITETNPVTGETRTKTRLGGAHPGLRRQQPTQVPSSTAARFVARGGGNALTLVEGPTSSPLVKVTLPSNVHGGQTIHVRSPDGRINEIMVPQGFGPGSSFLVEFAPVPEASQAQKLEHYSSNTIPRKSHTPAAGALAAETRPDDGFATGFNNPNWTPTATAVSPSSYDAYPISTATAVPPHYSHPPQYPPSPY